MLRRTVHILASLWLALLLLFGVTPKEAIHLFAGHKDTVHKLHPKGLSFEKEHHHCAFLGFVLHPFSDDLALPRCPVCYASPMAATRYPAFAERGLLQARRYHSLRGPPVC